MLIAIGLIIRQKQGHVDSNRSNYQTEAKIMLTAIGSNFQTESSSC